MPLARATAASSMRSWYPRIGSSDRSRTASQRSASRAAASAAIQSGPAAVVGTPKSGGSSPETFSVPPRNSAPTTSWPMLRAVWMPHRVTGG